jgi:hypothetical protein
MMMLVVLLLYVRAWLMLWLWLAIVVSVLCMVLGGVSTVDHLMLLVLLIAVIPNPSSSCWRGPWDVVMAPPCLPPCCTRHQSLTRLGTCFLSARSTLETEGLL